MLTNISGSFQIKSNVALTLVSFPAMITLGGLIDIESSSLLSFMPFPLLSTVSRLIDIYSNSGLTLVSFAAMKSVGSAVYIVLNNVLNSISIPSLTTVGYVIFMCADGPGLIVPSNILAAGHASGPSALCLASPGAGCCHIANGASASLSTPLYTPC